MLMYIWASVIRAVPSTTCSSVCTEERKSLLLWLLWKVGLTIRSICSSERTGKDPINAFLWLLCVLCCTRVVWVTWSCAVGPLCVVWCVMELGPPLCVVWCVMELGPPLCTQSGMSRQAVATALSQANQHDTYMYKEPIIRKLLMH